MITSILLASCLGAATAAASPAPLTLEQAVAAARARSPRREAAVERAEAARAAAKLAARWPNPRVELRTENVTGGGWYWSPPPDPRPPPGWTPSRCSSQDIELGGKRGARRALAGAEAGAADAALAQAERTVVSQTVRLYLDALAARETLAALAAHREAFGGLQEAMAARVREGLAAEADLAKFQAEAGRFQALEARTRIEMDRSLGLLAALIAEPAPITSDRLVEPASPPTVAGETAALAATAVERAPTSSPPGRWRRGQRRRWRSSGRAGSPT